MGKGALTVPLVNELEDLRNTVQDAILQGRIGKPQFMRCIAVAADSAGLESVLKELTALGESWFGASPTGRHRLGEGSGVHLTEMLTWPQGQGATIVVSTPLSDGLPHIDLMLVGSRGTIYHEFP